MASFENNRGGSTLLVAQLSRVSLLFFRGKLSKLHKKDSILHVTMTFYFVLKERETRTGSGPICDLLKDGVV